MPHDNFPVNNRPAIPLALGALVGVCISSVLQGWACIIALVALIIASAVFWGKAPSVFVFTAALGVVLIRVYLSRYIAFDPKSSSILNKISEIRASLEHNCDQIYGYKASVVKGLLLGDKYEIPKWLFEIYSNNGIVHLFAVSGLHISILSGAILSALRGTARWFRSVALGLFLILYIALTNFSPSAIRASIMIVIVLSSRLTERRADYLSAFCIAIFITLLIFPDSVGTASFLLSYGAMYGLLMLTEPVKKLIPMPFKRIQGLIASGIAVNLTLLPWFAAFFGSVSATAIPATLIIMPLASVLIIFSFLSVLVYYISPGLAMIIAYVPKGMIYCINWVMELINVGSLSVPAPSIYSMAFWFMGIFLLSPYYLPNRSKPPYLGLTFIAVSVILWIPSFLV